MPDTFRLAVVLGTRPEGIKLAPVIHESLRNPRISRTIVINTGQHAEMLDSVLNFFSIRPEISLDLMRPEQSLAEFTSRAINTLSETLANCSPDMLMVQGDTTTAMAAALSAFYNQIPVAHVEAGLRTDNLYSPFPEEVNRRIIGQLASVHLAPTVRAKRMIERDALHLNQGRVYVTGNTVIDALHLTRTRLRDEVSTDPDLQEFRRWKAERPDRSIVLVTGHRRENFGNSFREICLALRDLATAHPQTRIVYPVHLNPNVMRPVREILSGFSNVSLLSPKDYPTFVSLMLESKLIITDSGGVQEEAPALGKPVLVTRENTERPEALAGGGVKLVGPSRKNIFKEADSLLRDPVAYSRMSVFTSPYGDGRASGRCIAAILGDKVEQFMTEVGSSKSNEEAISLDVPVSFRT